MKVVIFNDFSYIIFTREGVNYREGMAAEFVNSNKDKDLAQCLPDDALITNIDSWLFKAIWEDML